MKIAVLFSVLHVLFLFGINMLNAQPLKVSLYEDSIHSSFKDLKLSRTDSGRLAINTKIDKLFGEVLKIPESINHPFDSLINISKLRSDDGQIRIINWNIPLEDGTHLYFAYIQHFDKKKKYELFRLNDSRISIINPEMKELSDKKWYGALYYRILENKHEKLTYYTLLGWEGHTNFTTKKLIEAFYISGKKLVFGPPVFKMEKTIKNRLIFEYAEQAKMMLRYDDDLEMIVYDHLAPSLKKFEGQYMYYGPDMSQDGLKFEKGNWVLKPNLDLRNKEGVQKTKSVPVKP
jgi:hypothetical protein